MSKIISIPQPCHEDWNTMSPNDQGRHCDTCAKTVVDFSAMPPQQILFYLAENKNDKVCGRFSKDQLNDPIPEPEDFVKQLSYFKISFIKKIAAIFLFAFTVLGSSCNSGYPTGKTSLTGMIAVEPKQEIMVGDTVLTPQLGAPVIKDTPPPPPQIMGELAVMDTIQPISKPAQDCNYMVGKLMVKPQPAPKKHKNKL